MSFLYKIFEKDTGKQVSSEDMFVNQDGQLQWINILCNLVENPEDYIVKTVRQEKEKSPSGLFPVWGHGVIHLARQKDGQAVCGVRKLDWESEKPISEGSESGKGLICLRCRSVLEAEMQSEEKRNRNGKKMRRAA